MIREYLNDDDDSPLDSGYECPSSVKKVKKELESADQENFQYIRMDLDTLNCTEFQSNLTKDCLNSVPAKKTQVFDRRDYIRCVTTSS